MNFKRRGARSRVHARIQLEEDVGAAYESRWFTLFPTNLLSSDYLNPVGSSTSNQDTVIYLHNPASTTLTAAGTVSDRWSGQSDGSYALARSTAASTCDWNACANGDS